MSAAFAQGQYLIANVDLASCASCHSGMYALGKGPIPKFIVFQVSSREDSLEIEKMYQFGRMGFQLLFDDSLYTATRVPEMSSLHIYDADLQKVAVRDLRQLSKEYITDSLSFLKAKKTQFVSNVQTVHRPHFYCNFDNALRSLKVYDRSNDSLLFQIRSSEFPYEELAKKLPKEKREKLNELSIDINRSGGGIGSGYSSFALDGEDNIWLRFEYALIRDSMVNGETKYFASGENCMVKLDQQGKIAEIYPIAMNPEYYILDRTFHVRQDTFWFTTHDYRDWFRHKARRNASLDLECIAQYAVQDGQLVFTKPIPYQLPFIYATRYYEDGLNAFPSIFPYYNLFLSNEILNVETGKMVHIVDDEAYRSKVSARPPSDLIDFPNEVLRVTASYLTSAGHFCIFYFYENDWWVKAFDRDLNVVFERNLAFVSSFIEATFLELDPYFNKISFKKKDPDEVIVLPLDFIVRLPHL